MLVCAAIATDFLDLRGKLTTTTHLWNVSDRLSRVLLPNAPPIVYTYDDGGRRVKVANGLNLTNYIWDETSPYGDVVQEFDAQGVQTVAYVLGGTELIAQSRSGATQFYLQDGQMSTRLLTDASGGVLNRYTYEAFGTTREMSGNAENVYQYTGQQFDGESGLYSLRARYYDPGVGRFGSRDKWPIDFSKISVQHRYQYASNQPIDIGDLSGNNDYAFNLGFGTIRASGDLALRGFATKGLLSRDSGSVIWGLLASSLVTSVATVDWETLSRDIIETAKRTVDGEPVILYRATALKNVWNFTSGHGGLLWVTTLAFYAGYYCIMVFYEDEDTCVISIYVTRRDILNMLVASGNVQHRLTTDYGFNDYARQFLIGPFPIVVPDKFNNF
jgi:RHS repeat-associated protein